MSDRPIHLLTADSVELCGVVAEGLVKAEISRGLDCPSSTSFYASMVMA